MDKVLQLQVMAAMSHVYCNLDLLCEGQQCGTLRKGGRGEGRGIAEEKGVRVRLETCVPFNTSSLPAGIVNSLALSHVHSLYGPL